MALLFVADRPLSVTHCFFCPSQAARAADFAIPSFRCLGSLILVHGRLSLQRTSVIAIYCV